MMKEIIEHLRDVAKDDSLVADFLIDLFLEEKQNPTQRAWKEKYRHKLDEYADRLGDDG